MNIFFRPTKFTWWQLGLLKWAVLFIGIAIGAVWHDIFSDYAMVLAAVGLLLSIYLAMVWLRGK